MRLLMIEDNKELIVSVKAGLEKAGFQVDAAYDAASGEELALVNTYDAVLLDLNLPDGDGLDVLQAMRSHNVQTPVIILTARDDTEDCAKGLDLGADDYLTKPFQLLELRARIQAVIRRYYGRTNPLIEIGSLKLNPSSRKVQWNEEKIALSSKEFDILEYLCERYPAVVSSEEIVEHVYDSDFDPFSTVLRVHLSRLRKKLETVCGRNILVTTRGKGYSICVDD